MIAIDQEIIREMLITQLEAFERHRQPGEELQLLLPNARRQVMPWQPSTSEVIELFDDFKQAADVIARLQNAGALSIPNSNEPILVTQDHSHQLLLGKGIQR